MVFGEALTARLSVIEPARTQEARVYANVIFSCIPGSRHHPGRERLPPQPDALYEWEPVGYPDKVGIGDDEDLASGFRSFGAYTTEITSPAQLKVIAHADRLTAKAVEGALKTLDGAEWAVIMMTTCDDWATGYEKWETDPDPTATLVLAPMEYWVAKIDEHLPMASIRWDLTHEALLRFRRLGQPREVGTVLFLDLRPQR